jgi:hypothetical protein
MRRIPAALLILAWLAASAYFFVLHALSDTGRHTAGYFWTWDMYPGYETASARRIVLARTADGRWLRLLPDGRHQFRLHARTGDLDAGGVPLPRGHSRIDLNRSDGLLRRAVASAVERHAGDDAASPLVQIAVVDCYWPARFNLPAEWAEPAAGLSSARPHYWRIAAEAAVDEMGLIQWQPRSSRP